MSISKEKRMEDFLKDDLKDALRWLFVGAITWCSARGKHEELAQRGTPGILAMEKPDDRIPNQDAHGMFTSLLQARALYEFYFDGRDRLWPDDVRARFFTINERWKPVDSSLYLGYMATNCSANKRLFHLVYDRSDHPGGNKPDESDHIKNRVLDFAVDLSKITREFADNAKSEYQDVILKSLAEDLVEAKKVADHYMITNPLA